jgi:hypothetical protein
MMEAWFPVFLVAALAGGLILFASRVQSASYRAYLDKQLAETTKLVDAQKAMQEAVNRQTAALERIALVLEKR